MVKTCATTLNYLHELDYDISGHKISFHHILLVLCALFGLIALVISFVLMQLHATRYSKPWEQQHIIRILFMVPVYSLVSFLSYYYYRYAVYWELIRDCYEAFAIASFFTLLCHYVAPNLHDQKEYFRTLTPKNWIWPITWMQKCTGGKNRGPFRVPRSGLTWFNVIWIGVFQYCFIRPAMTVVAVITQAFGLYCQDSLSPAYGHIWTTVIDCIAVTIAMYSLIQFYVQMRTDLAPHRPFIKIISIKLVIFFCFWQTLLITFLASSSGPLQPTAHIGRPDIIIGIPSMALCIEMAAFAILHIFAYPYKVYHIGGDNTKPLHRSYNDSVTPDNPTRYQGGPLGIWAWVDAFNPWDIIKACGRGFKWLFIGHRYRHEDVSYDMGESTKLAHLESRNSSDDKPLPAIPSNESPALRPYPGPQAYAPGQADVSGRTNGGQGIAGAPYSPGYDAYGGAQRYPESQAQQPAYGYDASGYPPRPPQQYQ